MSLTDPSSIFIGHDPSIFSFLAIASIFESEIAGDPDENQGYHMSLGARSQLGDYVPDLKVGIEGYVNIRIELEGTGVALLTQRSYKMEPFAILLGVLGSIAGVMAAIIATMRISEIINNNIRSRYKQIKAEEKIRPNPRLQEYYDENLDVSSYTKSQEGNTEDEISVEVSLAQERSMDNIYVTSPTSKIVASNPHKRSNSTAKLLSSGYFTSPRYANHYTWVSPVSEANSISVDL